MTLLAFALILAVLFVWAVYEALHAAGGERPQTVIILMVVSLFFLFLLAQGIGGVVDAVACADTAELVMKAEPGGRGVVEWDFLRCTIYWFR